MVSSITSTPERNSNPSNPPTVGTRDQPIIIDDDDIPAIHWRQLFGEFINQQPDDSGYETEIIYISSD